MLKHSYGIVKKRLYNLFIKCVQITCVPGSLENAVTVPFHKGKSGISERKITWQ